MTPTATINAVVFVAVFAVYFGGSTTIPTLKTGSIAPKAEKGKVASASSESLHAAIVDARKLVGL